jgi:hypothetical protein
VPRPSSTLPSTMSTTPSATDDANEEHARLQPDLPSCVPVEGVSPFRLHNMPLSFIQVFAAVIDGLNTPEHLLEDGPVHVRRKRCTPSSMLSIQPREQSPAPLSLYVDICH